MSAWEDLDVAAMLDRREEATLSGNAGGFVVPLGTPLRRRAPEPIATVGYTTVRHSYLPTNEGVDSGAFDYEWAASLTK